MNLRLSHCKCDNPCLIMGSNIFVAASRACWPKLIPTGDYTICNNCRPIEPLEIAREYAAKDPESGSTIMKALFTSMRATTSRSGHLPLEASMQGCCCR